MNPLHTLELGVFKVVNRAVNSHYSSQFQGDEIYSEGGNDSITAPVYWGSIKQVASSHDVHDEFDLELECETLFHYRFKIEVPEKEWGRDDRLASGFLSP